MATKNILLSIKGDTSNAQKQVDALTGKVNKLISTLQKTSKATASAQAKLTQTMSTPSKGGGLFGGIGGALEAGRNKLGGAIDAIDTKVNKIKSTFTSWQKNIQSVGDSLRLLSQSVSTVGKVLTFMVSVPLAAFLNAQADTAIDFEDALKRVQKVTGNTIPQMKALSDMMRELAKNTATGHVELLQIAEIVGQMGVKAPDDIAKFVEIINMFAISTDMAAEAAALALGKLASAFDLDISGINKLANVMNELENNNAAFAKQIANSLGKWAQNAKLLGINSWQAAAFNATLIDMGFSEGEAGTALARLTTGLIQNADAVAAAMAGTEKYADAQAVLTAIEEDAFGVIIDLTKAMADGESKAVALGEAMEIGGLRGGRGLAGLSGNIATLSDNLALAENQWNNSTSLMKEYELAMTSTKNQMGLLKNNINDVGITLGDALLPTINQIIQVLVPALRLFNEWFKSLDGGTKRMIVLGAVGAVALGPALFMFGQLANALSLVILGFGRIIMLIPTAIGSVLGLLKPILMVGQAFLSWPGLVAAAIAGIIAYFVIGAENIAAFFTDLAEKATAWGERLAETYAGGFIAGAATYIARALTWVANLIASFFQGHSPPKAGPLKTINKWGAKIMEAYLEGFKKADFSILSEIGQTIEQWLTRGLSGKDLAGALEKVAAARFGLSQLIAKFNETGIIDEAMLAKVTSGLGPIADNVRDLVKNWLEYNRIQEKIAAIEERRKQVKRTYTDELKGIAGSTKNIKDKIRAIRAAQRARDDNLRGLDEEQEALEEQAAYYKEQVEMQKAMVDAMQTQEDLFQRIADTLEGVKSALTAPGGGFGDPDSDWPDPDVDLSELEDNFNSVKERIEEGKLALQGFIDAFNGMQPRDPEDTGFGTMYDTMYRLGTLAKKIKDTILEWADAGAGFVDEVKQKWEDFAESEGLDLGSLFEDFDIKDVPIIGDFIEGFELALKKTPAFDELALAWNSLKDAWERLKTALGTEGSANMFQMLGTAAFYFARGLGYVVGWIAGFIMKLVTWHAVVSAWGLAVVTSFAAWFAGLVSKAGDFWAKFGGYWETFKEIVTNALVNAGVTVGRKIAEIREKLSLGWTLIRSAAVLAWALIVSKVSSVFEGITTKISTTIEEARTTIETWVSGLATTLEGYVDTFKEWAGNLIDNFITGIEENTGITGEAIVAWIEAIKTKVTEMLGLGTGEPTFWTFGQNVMQGFIDGLNSMGDKVVGAIKDVVDAAVQKVMELLGLASPSKLFKEFGGFTTEGFEIGIKSGIGDLVKTVDDMVKSIIASVQSLNNIHAYLGLGWALDAAPVPGGGLTMDGVGRVGISEQASPALGGETHVHIHNPVIREEQDLDKIVQAVKKALGKETYSRVQFGGQIR